MRRILLLIILGTNFYSLSGQVIDSTLLSKLYGLSSENHKIITTDFSFFKYSLMTDEQDRFLETTLFYLQSTSTSIEIVVHSDCRGHMEYNDAITERKADIMQRWFFRRALDKDKVLVTGVGENFPIVQCDNCSECTEEDHSINQRLEIFWREQE
jgi:outer membrane protein OmpA-like peptidoglycan-associated protein